MRWFVYLLGLMGVFCTGLAKAQKPNPIVVDSLLAAAEDTALAFDLREKLMKQAMGHDRSGKTMHALARLYMWRNTLVDRQTAKTWINRAIHAERENGDYRATRAELLWGSMMRKLAYQEARKAVALSPNNVRALYVAGRFAAWSWEMTHYTDRTEEETGRATDEGVVVGQTSYQMEYEDIDLDVGIAYLSQVLVIDPTHGAARRSLGLLYYEAKMPEHLVVLFEGEQAIPFKNWEVHFFAGMGYQMQLNMALAYRHYVDGLSQMDVRTQQFMQSIFMLRNKKDEKKDIPMPSEADLSAFWQGRDPLYLTPVNERLMEQCRRVAYANLRFGDPVNGYAGWETDRGQAYIRYGSPQTRYMKPASVDLGFELLPTEEMQRPPGSTMVTTFRTETWAYDTFTVTFLNTNSWDSWRFGPAWIGDLQVTSGELIEKMPAYYQYPFQYDVPFQVAQFRRDDGQTEVEVYYALPSEKVKHQEVVPGVQSVDVKKGLFVFDSQWDTIRYEVTSVKQMPKVFYDGTEESFLFSGEHVQLKPGAYVIAGEAEDQVSKQVGTFRVTLDVRDFGMDSLAVSNLLLARRIVEREDRPFGRERFMVLPNPLRQCRRDGSVSFYFEIYNLTRDTFGATHYQVNYQMRVLPEELESIKPEWMTAVSNTYDGTHAWEPHQLQIDLQGASPGLREIRVVVTDMKTLAQAEGMAQFRVVW